jgi:D-sedoheptulose 7-phosphate isomerase
MTTQDTHRIIAEHTAQHIEVIRRLGQSWAPTLAAVVDCIVACFRAGGKVLLAGNGGSAADAQHIAGELVGRLLRERAALPAVTLSADTSILTAIGNDYGFDRVFARQVEALGRPGDVLWVLSTSGNSPNILAAVEVARSRGMKVISFSGRDGGKVAPMADVALVVPDELNMRIQEAHGLAYHIVCDLVEGIVVSG